VTLHPHFAWLSPAPRFARRGPTRYPVTVDTAKAKATYARVLELGEDVRAEVIEGVLETQPSPLPRHARAQGALRRFVGGPFDDDDDRGGPGGWWILTDVDVRLSEHDIVPPSPLAPTRVRFSHLDPSRNNVSASADMRRHVQGTPKPSPAYRPIGETTPKSSPAYRPIGESTPKSPSRCGARSARAIWTKSLRGEFDVSAVGRPAPWSGSRTMASV